uniref:Placenta associated 8 n=1 Tax=Sus scrofa TaxID=9823 RepID=A0A8D0VC61_PIG
ESLSSHKTQPAQNLFLNYHSHLRSCIQNASSGSSGHCDSARRWLHPSNLQLADRLVRLLQRLRRLHNETTVPTPPRQEHANPPTPSLCGIFCFSCLAVQVASDLNECCLCGTSVAMRTLYRTRYGIPGSICDDFMVTLCCPMCSLCQIKRDINRRRAMHSF